MLADMAKRAHVTKGLSLLGGGQSGAVSALEGDQAAGEL